MAELSGVDTGAGFDTVLARRRGVVVVRLFLRHRLAVASLAVFLALVVFAFLGSALWKYSYTYENTTGTGRYLPPSLDHPFGTDELAADSFAQVLRGAQFSLLIALTVAALSTAIGVVLGAVAGYYRGWVDSLISRFLDLVLVIPTIVIVAVLVRGTGGSWYLIALFLGATTWPGTARVIRGLALSLREKEFVEAARALGGSSFRLVFRHVVPNTLDVIIVNATLAVSQAVLAEAALSFLGLGVHAPDTSLGALINLNQYEITVHPWLFWFPFGFIVLISLTVNFIGDGLRDAFDPRQTRVRA